MRRALQTGIVLLSANLVFLAGWTALSPEPAPQALMPAAEGELTDLAIQFHRPGERLFLDVYGQLLQALDPSVTVHVVTADATDEQHFRAAYATWFPDADGPSLRFAHTDKPITSWMRDRLAVVGDHLLAPAAPMPGVQERVNDWTVPWTLGEHLDRPVAQSTWTFEGGDLISGPERAIVASPLFDRNPDVPEHELIALLERDLGRPVLALHDTPTHHIGMFLTPIGAGRVAVADPTLGLQVLADAGLQPETVLAGGAPIGRVSDEDLARFTGVAQQLEAQGFDVVRLPVLPTTQDYAWITYNNVLAETRDGRLHVYMPTYGVDALDEAGTHAWQAAGAVVHPIDVEALFRLGGSVRCLTAPVGRQIP